MDDTLEDWFRREILPYEAALMRYLGQKRAIRVDAEDLRNEVYVRIIESAEQARPTVPKAFLFGTARNLLIDLARRDRVVAIDLLEDLSVLNVLIDNISPEQSASGRQQLQRVSMFFDRMPAKCREVLWMRRIEGMPQKEVAMRLGITEGTVEKYVHRAMRYLADALFGNAGRKEVVADRHVSDAGNPHGE